MTPSLATMNLNLLVALDALFDTRSVTAAARRVGVSQPAMSRSLKSLREMFDDPLLVRGTDGLVLTPRASLLREPLRRSLTNLAGVVAGRGEFDPATSTRRFTVEMPDYLMGLLGPALCDRVLREAPGVTLDVRLAHRDDFFGRLEAGTSDVLVHACLEPPAGLRGLGLVRDRFACAVRKGHPHAPKNKKKMPLKTYAALPHCLIAVSDEAQVGSVDLALQEHGLRRHVAFRVRSFLAAPVIVAASDAILTGPARLLRWFAERYPLEVFDAPISVHDFEYIALWHERFEAEPAHAWLRGLLVAAAGPHAPDARDRDWRALWGHATSTRRRSIQRGTRGAVI
jgi:DNA-binding transcriptional LysR family regulator